MAITLNETGVKNSAEFSGMLLDLQVNILKHHGRDVAWHVLLSVKNSKVADAQKWISDFAVTKITSAFKQLTDTEKRKNRGLDGGTVYTLSLSAKGYQKLNVNEAIWPEDAPFLKGMRGNAAALSDDASQWENGFHDLADILIIVADSDEDVAAKAKDDLIASLNDAFEILKSQEGKILKRGNVGIEHFGYADGISQPLFMAEELEGRPGDKWDDTAQLKLALVRDKGGKTENSFGSYLVFRKLEQNVKKFKDEEEKIKISDTSGTVNDELSGAMITGRFEDGTQTIDHDREQGHTDPDKIPNNFNYPPRAGESKCPFHSHIRITNPRADVGDAFAHQVRLVRRGIPFDECGRNGNLDIHPESGVGLLFMCYQASISSQFQFIQEKWINEGEIGPGRFVGQDGIIGQGHNNKEKRLPLQWGQDMPDQLCDFSNPKSGFVTMRGGEYFFTPSISFLVSLFTGNDAGEAMEALL